MPDPDSMTPSSPEGAGFFRTTHWSVVQRAGEEGSPEAHAALTRLCQTYWRPIYAFIRKRGHSPEQSEDLAQEFFSRFLEKNHVARAARERGRFRSFLMTSVENFLRNDHERRQAQKRGGGIPVLALGAQEAEEWYADEPREERDPAQAFDRRWAATVLQTSLDRLRAEFAAAGRRDLFDALQAHMWGDEDSVPYPRLAEQFGQSLPNIKVQAYRLRQRYREILREEIAHTLSQPGEIDEEIRYLMRVVSQ